MKAPTIELSTLAISDILEQADWYEFKSGEGLAKRWQRVVTSTLLRIHKAPNSGTPCRFRSTELQGIRRVLITGFPKHLVFYQFEKGAVLILRIVHGARDLESLFSE